MATYYELLDVAPTADLDTIKSAFRREIARYHPDKVQHLGSEFQAMASERAARLTAAYKTLMDPDLRADYDAALANGSWHPPAPQPSPAAATARHEPPAPAPPPPPSPPSDSPGIRDRFEHARVGRDSIMRRAVVDHVRQAVDDAFGPSDEVHVRGFDLVLVPRGGGGLLRSAMPTRVLARFAPAVDAALAVEMWSAAARARLHLTGAPLCVLLIGHTLAPQADLSGAIKRQRAREIPGTPRELAIVPVDVRDWTARIPADAPAPLRRLVDRLQKWA